MKIAIITPVYNDWDSFLQLVGEIDAVFKNTGDAVFVQAINDGSVVAPPDAQTMAQVAGSFTAIHSIGLLNLLYNLGHQRAIALGLAEIVNRGDFDVAVILDCDGEDRPADIPDLLAQWKNDRGKIVVARRRKRSEGLFFRFFYLLYKLTFACLTGRKISFGNFSVLSPDNARRLVNMPEMWNHIAGAYLRSSLPLGFVSTDRGQRYAGEPKMNIMSLFSLGVSAISVFADHMFIRMLLFGFALAFASLLGIVAVVGVRMFTDLAIPGWASYMTLGLAVIFIQTLLLGVVAAIQAQGARSAMTATPMVKLSQMVDDRQTLLEG